jgi:hypothetical protein
MFMFTPHREVCVVDRELIDGIREVALLESGFYVRRVFANLPLSNSMSKSRHVWEQIWDTLYDGIVYHRCRSLNIHGEYVSIFFPQASCNNICFLHCINFIYFVLKQFYSYPS